MNSREAEPRIRSVRINCTGQASAALGLALDQLSPSRALRTLAYVPVDFDGENYAARGPVRLSAVVDVDGVLVGRHLSSPSQATSADDSSQFIDHLNDYPDLAPHVPGALAECIAAADTAALKKITGIEFHLDKGKTLAATVFSHTKQPPRESGAEHHVWHYAPELDDLNESLHPESWWEKLSEVARTLIGRFRTRHSPRT